MARPLFTRIALTLAAVAAVTATGGCSSSPGGETTCSTFAGMKSDTGLMSNASDEQQAVIRTMLRDHDRDTGVSNVSMAYLQIVAYCNIYGGRSGSNGNSPIEGIPGLR